MVEIHAVLHCTIVVLVEDPKHMLPFLTFFVSIRATTLLMALSIILVALVMVIQLQL